MVMTDRNEALVREAYEAYGRGDVARMLEFVDPELEWTYLNPAFENPEPGTCRGVEVLTTVTCSALLFGFTAGAGSVFGEVGCFYLGSLAAGAAGYTAGG
jgi:hypothetical protein